MRFAIAIAVAIAVVWVAPLRAGAEEIRLGVWGAIEYDSNLFNTDEPGQQIDDTSIRVGPILGLRRSQGNFTYQIQYEPRWETFIDGSADDAWDHNLFANALWQISPRTTLQATNRFLITRSLNRSSFLTDPGQPDVGATPQLEVARQKITRNLTALTLDHQFTERLEGIVDTRYDFFTSDRESSFDSGTLGLTARSLYLLRPADRVGGGAGFTWQRFDGTDTQPGSDTIFYRLFASWVHQFSPTFTFTINAGPAFIQQNTRDSAPLSAVVPQYPSRGTTAGGLRTIDSVTCPTNDDDLPYLADDCGLLGAELTGPDAAFVAGTAVEVFQASSESDPDIRTTLFGTAELAKSWQRWRTAIRYQRTDSGSSGVAQSSILDFFSWYLIWLPDDNWSSRINVGWTNRQSSSDQTANAVGLGVPEGIAFPPPSTTLANGSPSNSLLRVQSDNFVNVQTWSAGLRVARNFGRGSEAFVRFVYLNQSFDGETARRNFDDYRIGIGVRLVLDWMRPW